MFKNRVWLYGLILIAALPSAFAYQSWGRAVPTPGQEFFRALCGHPLSPDQLLLATSHQIYEKTAEKKETSLRETFSPDIEIQKLKIFPAAPSKVFALTHQGIYFSDFTAPKWQKIFALKTRGSSVLSFTVSPENPGLWLTATTEGLFKSEDSGKSWDKISFFKNKPVSLVFFSKNILFAASEESLYYSVDLSFFEKSLTKNFFDTEAFFEQLPADEVLEDSDPPASGFHFFYAEAARSAQSQIWVATEQGIFETLTDGQSWEKLSTSGLKNTRVRDLVFSEETGTLYAATSSDVYAYSLALKSWAPLFQGLTHPLIYDLHLSPNILWAATSEGLMQFPLLPDKIIPPEQFFIQEGNLLLLKTLFRLEPGVRDLQHWVIKYANVHNHKTKNWHLLSRLRAVFPSFSFGKDFSRGNNTDIDRGSTSEPDVYIAGPEDIDKGWDADISWDFGDLLFSSNQTSIDSREKLTIELRNDLLSEATRIYFERRRLQMETVLLPAQNIKDHFDRLLHMDELTALLDSLSDGKFGESVKEIYAEHPELEELWILKSSGVRDERTN